MIAILLALLCGTANALEVKAPSPNSGTITPTAITAVTGSFSGSVTASSVTALGGMALDAGASGTPQISFKQGGAGKGYLTYWNSTSSLNLQRTGSAEGNGLSIDASDRVGVGTASPATKLHMSSGTLTVDGNQSGDVLTVRSNLSNADLHFLLETTGTGGSESSRIDLKTTNRHWLIQNAKGLSNGFAIRDETAGSATRLFIDDAGKVGIGTTAPESANKLQVQAASGNVVVASSATATGFGVFSAHGTSGGCIMLTDTDNAGWTKCKALNGTLSCATDADGICD